MSNKKLICFDVDGTLTENKSSWAFLTGNLGCPVEKVVEIYEKTENGSMPFEEGVDCLEKMYFESGKASKQNIQDIFNKISLRDDAKETVDYLKQSGYGVYLISGSIDLYLDIVAQKVEADGFFGHASFDFDNSGALAKINYGREQGPTKARQIKELSRKLDVPDRQVIFVGDSRNDIEAFKLTGHGIAIYPYDRELEKIAWKKIKSLSEIKNILQ
ncbi:MAG: HAD-IB family phosphatase [Candidatus Nealsonbacteria bacterium DGGOD1a]|jgi:Haloacid Dehalogenase superfamily, subfamily IB, phosphoserine phosphatase-like|nr:MAG: HAD-IB family phosphatase [Candidatus Nealsonbacteria bacterium DGGOD1a]